jgi:hypothetical protein
VSPRRCLVSWFPSAPGARRRRARSRADISKIEPGQQITVEWRGKPVWILKRTPEMLEKLKGHDQVLADPESKAAEPAAYVKGPERSIKPEVFVPRALHPPRLLATAEEGNRRRFRHGRRLARRLLLPLPQLALRPLGARVQGLARPDQPRHPAAPLRSDALLVIGEDTKGPEMAVRTKTPVTGAGPFNGILTWSTSASRWCRCGRSTPPSTTRRRTSTVVLLRLARALVLVIQIVSGIFLTMNYKPSARQPSPRSSTSCATSRRLAHPLHPLDRRLVFFICVYLHMARGLMYGSYRKPRELIWIFGVLIYLTLMARPSSATCCRGARCRTGARR